MAGSPLKFASLGRNFSKFLQSSRQFSCLNNKKIWSPAVLVADKDVFQTSKRVASSAKPHDHSLHFKIERLWTAAMLPLFPAALFIHNPTMDFLLATAIALHVHWGFDVVLGDYLEPLGLNDTLKKLAPYFIYAVTLVMYTGMLHFNYSDVGITKAFELIWSL